jgi:hypothetical protein
MGGQLFVFDASPLDIELIGSSYLLHARNLIYNDTNWETIYVSTLPPFLPTQIRQNITNITYQKTYLSKT